MSAAAAGDPEVDALGVAAERVLAELGRRGYADAEVFEKRGRSRTVERAAGRETRLVTAEAGWAVRAGDARRSIFYAATGAPDIDLALPDASPHALLLPEAPPVAGWIEIADEPPQLATENEANALFEAIEHRLGRELPGARLAAVRVDDGASESFLVSTRGARARVRSRAAWLRLEAVAGERKVELALADRTARGFRPEAIARRLADRLAALEGVANAASGPTKVETTATLLVAAPLAARLVEALAPLFVGRAATTRLAPLLGAGGRLASAAITLVDDGALSPDEGGLLAAPYDGEGLPTGRTVLVEKGRFRVPLLAWWEADTRGPGCARRASWRDLPRRAPTHFYLVPGEAAATELVASVADGAYLIDAEGAVELDLATLSFRVPVSGFRLSGGVAAAPLGPRRLAGPISALLGSIRALARDLTFVPGDGLYGAPTLLLEPAPEGEPIELLGPAPR